MTAPPPVALRAEVLSIGDELVHGSLLDTNARWLAQELERHGVAMQRFTVVGDDPAQLRAALQAACARAELVVATGGLGPTLDDRTREVAAELAGGPMWFDEASWQHIEGWLKGRRRPVPESNRRQAEFPPGAAPLHNPVGTAPGFRLRLGTAELFALPGVPREMQRMVQDHVVPFLQQQPGRLPLWQHCLRVLGPSEALLGERIAAFMHHDREPVVGVTASGGLLTVRIVGRALDPAAAAAACERTASELRPLLGDWLVAEGQESLAELCGQRLLVHGVSLALAESCTGGLIAARLTDVPGISAVFRGGVVSYTNGAKQDLLGVPADLLAEHGAVSEPVVRAMARGARERLGADLALAVSGIAGPGGATPDKPVGTVCFGLDRAPAAGGGGAVEPEAWTVRIAALGREFVRERAAFEVFAAILRRLPPAGSGPAS
ncbi:MAG: competence/damage-inducible protein A [Planctomycetota bacterium]